MHVFHHATVCHLPMPPAPSSCTGLLSGSRTRLIPIWGPVPLLPPASCSSSPLAPAAPPPSASHNAELRSNDFLSMASSSGLLWLWLLSLSRNSPLSHFPLPRIMLLIELFTCLSSPPQLEGSLEEFHWLPNTQNLEQGWRPRRQSTDRCCWEHSCNSFTERFL